MTRLDAITEAYTIATGKSNLPIVGSSKRSKLTAAALKYYRDWQTETSVGEWQSLYQVITAGTVTTGSTFDLDTEVHFLSQQDGNYVRINMGNNNYIDYAIVKPQQLYQYRGSRAVALITNSQIQFSTSFKTGDSALGGTIEVPASVKLDDLTSDTSEVLIDNPAWLPARIAAAYVLTDRQLNYLYDDLLQDANDLMQGMINYNNVLGDSYNTGINYFPVEGGGSSYMGENYL